MKEQIIIPFIELSIVQQLIQIIGLEEIRFAFALLHLIVSDLQSFIKNQHDVPFLMNILQNYLEDSKNDWVRQKLHKEVRKQFHSQLRQSQDDFNNFIRKKQSTPINNQPKNHTVFRRIIIIKSFNTLVLLAVGGMANKFESRIQQQIEKSRKLRLNLKFPTIFINPNEIFEIRNYQSGI